MILFGFAFLAGIVTVLSPCILPVLPVVLSGSVAGGKARPLGIITGFVLSFALFTLTLSAIVSAFKINPDVLRYIAAVTILLFGLVMVVPILKDRFSLLSANLAHRKQGRPIAAGQKAVPKGYGSGFVLGISLGLVWTPCVGPIMASVISLALSSRLEYGSVFITLAYAVGTAIPLFLIMQGGRQLLARISFLSKNTNKIQKVFGVLMIITSIALFNGADRRFQSMLLDVFPSYGAGLTAIEDNELVKQALHARNSTSKNGSEIKAVAEIKGSFQDIVARGSGVWLNSPPLGLEDFKDKVVLVDFWTYSCINCLRTLPYLRAWQAAYADKGLLIVGVHSPEFAFEKSESNLRKAMADLGISWPVVQDNDFGIWRAYENRYWPAHYLYGRDGKLVSTHFGEGAYEETETLIRSLLIIESKAVLGSELPKELVSKKISGTRPSSSKKTEETYLGFARAERFSSIEGLTKNKNIPYTVPLKKSWGATVPDLVNDHWALSGNWKVAYERAIAEEGSSLYLNFTGAKVYLVMSPVQDDPSKASLEPVEVLVSIDGKAVSSKDVRNGVLSLDGDRMYTLFDKPRSRKGLLKLEFRGRAAVYAFTFG
ncbi:cytochrome c biogenesis protein DipZ [Treponema sp.]